MAIPEVVVSSSEITSSSSAVPSLSLCVESGTSSSVPSRTVSTVPTPTPTQAGMVVGCKDFYFAQAGDGCWAVTNAHGILVADFYSWNPAFNIGG